MISDRTQFSLSLAVVSWRAQLWANHQMTAARVEPVHRLTLQQPIEQFAIWQRSGIAISPHESETTVTPNHSLRGLKGDQ